MTDRGLTPTNGGEIAELRFLKQGDRLFNLSHLQNPIDRAQAAQEIKISAFDSLVQNQLVHFAIYGDDNIRGDPDLADKLFGRIRPDGRLLGALDLVYNIDPNKKLTVSVFEIPTGELIIHKKASPDWDMNFDGATLVVAAIATGIVHKPEAQVSIVETEILKTSWQEIIDIMCLGFHPDQDTGERGAWATWPRFILDAPKSPPHS